MLSKAVIFYSDLQKEASLLVWMYSMCYETACALDNAIIWVGLRTSETVISHVSGTRSCSLLIQIGKQLNITGQKSYQMCNTGCHIKLDLKRFIRANIYARNLRITKLKISRKKKYPTHAADCV